MRWDIFCTVIDNYGDIGVCWRLARQFVHERGHAVRLWLDDLSALQALRGPLADVNLGACAQTIDGVDVRHWGQPFVAQDDAQPGDVVVEAFACELPDAWKARMAALPPRAQPVWINLEYLSAEAWTEDCHGLPSPQGPCLPCKFFFFPGFAAAGGGLLREREVDAYLQNPDAPADRWALPDLRAQALRVLLFCYPNPALPFLFDAWTAASEPIDAVVAAGHAQRCAGDWLHARGLDAESWSQADGASWVEQGALRLHTLPFVEQRAFDDLLRGCDLNFVRGEDSLVRGLWSARPLLWHLYPQQDDAHEPKLQAFAGLYAQGLEADAAQAWRHLMACWNDARRARECGPAWTALASALPCLNGHARQIAHTLAAQSDLATRLETFVDERLRLRA